MGTASAWTARAVKEKKIAAAIIRAAISFMVFLLRSFAPMRGVLFQHHKQIGRKVPLVAAWQVIFRAPLRKSLAFADNDGTKVIL